VLLGITALLGIDDAAVAAVILLALGVSPPRRALLWAAPAAAAVLAVWAVPLAVNYARYGGFHSITARDPANPTIGQAIVALGLLLPLGAGGAVVLARRDPGRRAVLTAIVGVPLAACAVALAAGTGHPPLGITAFVRWLRYLPLLAVALTPTAGECAARLSAAAARWRMAPVAVSAALAAGLGASTALAAAHVWSSPADRGLRCAPAPAIGQADVVAVATASAGQRSEVGFWLFSATGAHVLALTPHRARVRYADFPPGVPSQATRLREAAAVAQGVPPPVGVTWVVSDLPRAGLASTLLPAAACTWRGESGFTVYRVAGGGRLP
jgi:hypothetical protein